MTPTEESTEIIPRPGMKDGDSGCPKCGEEYALWHPLDAGGSVLVPPSKVCVDEETIYIHPRESQ